MHITTGRAVPLIWFLLNSQSTVDLIVNAKMLANIRKVWDEEATRLHCYRGVNIVNRVGNIPGYGTVWYKPTGIANIFLMSRAMKKVWVVFDSKGGIFPGWSSRPGKCGSS